MPRVNIGTKEQKEQREVERLAKEIMTGLNEKRGRDDMSKQELADFVGITPNCLLCWNKGAARKASFETLVIAAIRCGGKITVEFDRK